jgi:hypothetical protein
MTSISHSGAPSADTNEVRESIAVVSNERVDFFILDSFGLIARLHLILMVSLKSQGKKMLIWEISYFDIL